MRLLRHFTISVFTIRFFKVEFQRFFQHQIRITVAGKFDISGGYCSGWRDCRYGACSPTSGGCTPARLSFGCGCFPPLLGSLLLLFLLIQEIIRFRSLFGKHAGYGRQPGTVIAIHFVYQGIHAFKQFLDFHEEFGVAFVHIDLFNQLDACLGTQHLESVDLLGFLLGMQLFSELFYQVIHQLISFFVPAQLFNSGPGNKEPNRDPEMLRAIQQHVLTHGHTLFIIVPAEFAHFGFQSHIFNHDFLVIRFFHIFPGEFIVGNRFQQIFNLFFQRNFRIFFLFFSCLSLFRLRLSLTILALLCFFPGWFLCFLLIFFSFFGFCFFVLFIVWPGWVIFCIGLRRSRRSGGFHFFPDCGHYIREIRRSIFILLFRQRFDFGHQLTGLRKCFGIGDFCLFEKI